MMTNFLVTHIRLVIWAIGATGVVVELAALSFLAQPTGFAEPEMLLPDLTACHTVPHFEATPLKVLLPRAISL